MDVSIIFATHNREDILADVFDAWREAGRAAKYSFEMICSDDASTDGTAGIIKKTAGLPVKLIENKKGGAAKARNAALKKASGKLIIFTGDDIFPQKDFINAHFENYLKFGEYTATLGRIDWHADIKVNHLMRHITEIGCEQFGFIALPVYQLVDFRHFYTSNISVPAKLLHAQDRYFSTDFDQYGFEDIELGYRLQKAGMRIYYDPDIAAYHHHVYDNVEKFCARQRSAGEQLAVFSHMHDDLGSQCICDVENAGDLFGKYQAAYAGRRLFRGKCLLGGIRAAKWISGRLERRMEKKSSAVCETFCSLIYAAVFRFYYTYGTIKRIAQEKQSSAGAAQLADFTSRYLKQPYQEIYWDIGRGFNENDARKWVYWDDSVLTFCQSIPDGAKSIRIAPLKDYCRAWIEKIEIRLSDGGSVSAEAAWHNACKSDGCYYDFSNTNDPCILIEELPAAGTEILVTMKVSSIRKTMGIYKTARNAAARMFHRAACAAGNAKQWQLEYAYGQPRRIQIGIKGRLPAEKKKELIAQYRAQVSVLGKDAVISDAEHMRMGYTDYFYDPCREPLDVTQMLQAAYTLLNQTADYLLISKSYAEFPQAACKDIADVLIYSSLLKKDSAYAWMNCAAGRYLRLPAQESESGIVDINEICSGIRLNPQAVLGTGRIHYRMSRRSFGKRESTKPLLFVIPVFFAVGGVERNTVEIMRRLKKEYDFCLITSECHTKEQGSLHDQLKGICSYIFDLWEIAGQEHHLEILFELKEIFQPQLVWLCNNSPWFERHMAKVREIFLDIPMIAQDVYDTKEGWIAYYKNPQMRTFDRYIAVTELIRETFIREYGIPEEKIDVIYSAVNGQRIKTARNSNTEYEVLCKKYGLDADREHYAYVGRLTEQKNPIRYLKLVREIIEKNHENMQFAIVGDGAWKDKADQLILEYHLEDRIVRIPYVENTPEFIGLLDGLVITSDYEGLPIVCIEAMGMGVPVISTDTGDIRRFIEKNKSGFIIDEKISDAENFTRFHECLADYKKNAQEYAEDMLAFFSAENACKKYLYTFRKACRDMERGRKNA